MPPALACHYDGRWPLNYGLRLLSVSLCESCVIELVLAGRKLTSSLQYESMSFCLGCISSVICGSLGRHTVIQGQYRSSLSPGCFCIQKHDLGCLVCGHICNPGVSADHRPAEVMTYSTKAKRGETPADCLRRDSISSSEGNSPLEHERTWAMHPVQ